MLGGCDTSQNRGTEMRAGNREKGSEGRRRLLTLGARRISHFFGGLCWRRRASETSLGVLRLGRWYRSIGRCAGLARRSCRSRGWVQVEAPRNLLQECPPKQSWTSFSKRSPCRRSQEGVTKEVIETPTLAHEAQAHALLTRGIVQIGGACDLTDLGLGDVREWEESLVEARLCDGRKVICLVFR